MDWSRFLQESQWIGRDFSRRVNGLVVISPGFEPMYLPEGSPVPLVHNNILIIDFLSQDTPGANTRLLGDVALLRVLAETVLRPCSDCVVLDRFRSFLRSRSRRIQHKWVLSPDSLGATAAGDLVCASSVSNCACVHTAPRAPPGNQEDENLTEEVEKHPSIFDISSPVYRDQHVKDITWKEISGLKEKIQDYISHHKLNESLFPVKSLFILIPSSGYIATCLTKMDSKMCLEEATSLDEENRNVAGVQARSYKNSIYKIRSPDNTELVYLAVEGATPVKTYYNVMRQDPQKGDSDQNGQPLDLSDILKTKLQEIKERHQPAVIESLRVNINMTETQPESVQLLESPTRHA
uniref:STING ligand-binding domain-containing protein n=1 Tax=Timema tahoe TaxID=61484 RepID=A0A7R9IPK6_9NEOP|nr:unnamed protein product [Timema tahoe]